MSGIEIALLVFGFACVIVSFFIVDNNERVEKGKTVAAPDTKAFNELSKKVISDTNNNAEKILSETEDKLEALSNDKIMAVGEYSDQVIEKIDTNHKEVVFLYQMLKEKEEELKSTATQLENVRIECEKLIREKEAHDKEVATLMNNTVAAKDEKVNSVTEEVQKLQNDVVDEKALNQKKSKNSESKKAQTDKQTTVLSNTQSERQYGWGEALALAEEQQESTDISERNQEIIELYKKKKSVLEISKLLGMGQGEVKLVIDLYCK